MYDFHYNFIKRIYPGDPTIFLFADMDSVMYYVKTEDLQKDMELSSSKFDFSEYPLFIQKRIEKSCKNSRMSWTAKLPINIQKAIFRSIYPESCLSICRFKVKDVFHQILEGRKKKKETRGIDQSGKKKLKHDNDKDYLKNQRTTNHIAQSTKKWTWGWKFKFP